MLSLLPRPPPASTPLPYTTLFRSGQEAFWGDYFNGVKSENPWAVHLPPERRGKDPIKIFGIEIGGGSQLDLTRPFMARFGEDRKSTRLNSSHLVISYAVFCLKKKI